MLAFFSRQKARQGGTSKTNSFREALGFGGDKPTPPDAVNGLAKSRGTKQSRNNVI